MISDSFSSRQRFSSAMAGICAVVGIGNAEPFAAGQFFLADERHDFVAMVEEVTEGVENSGLVMPKAPAIHTPVRTPGTICNDWANGEIRSDKSHYSEFA
jgi:hypothetical protein